MKIFSVVQEELQALVGNSPVYSQSMLILPTLPVNHKNLIRLAPWLDVSG